MTIYQENTWFTPFKIVFPRRIVTSKCPIQIEIELLSS